MLEHCEKEKVFALLEQIGTGIHRLLYPFAEVLIHDFSDFEHSIIFIEGGEITGRSVGGAATDLLLTQAKNGNTQSDFYNYRTALPNGKHMKSATMFLRDENGDAYGAFCINVDISALETMHKLMGGFLDMEAGNAVSETLSDDIQKTIHSILMETIQETEKDIPIMNRDEKINLIARLDDKGVFQVKKAVPVLADELGLSRATVYNYLTEARDKQAAERS
jgi:predicted transcriptional regulator YheO